MIRDLEIKPTTFASLRRYVDDGCPTGDFLEAVLSNDLFDACGRADADNLITLAEIVAWIYNEAPSTCHGSRQRYADWIEKHRVRREGAA